MPSKDKLAKLLDRFTLAEIGQKFNVSFQAVQYWCRAYDLTKRYVKPAYVIQPCKQCGSTHRDEAYKKRALCSAECWNARKAESRERRRLYRRSLHEKRKESGPPPQAQHGKASTYRNYGCRCESCKSAQAVKNAERRRSKAKT